MQCEISDWTLDQKKKKRKEGRKGGREGRRASYKDYWDSWRNLDMCVYYAIL